MTTKLVPTGPAMEVEARLFHGPDAATIYRHLKAHERQQVADAEPTLDVTDNQCIHPVPNGEGMRACGKVVPTDLSHGWLCRFHARQGRVELPNPEHVENLEFVKALREAGRKAVEEKV